MYLFLYAIYYSHVGFFPPLKYFFLSGKTQKLLILFPWARQNEGLAVCSFQDEQFSTILFYKSARKMFFADNKVACKKKGMCPPLNKVRSW